jgi:hypothetical protein
MKNLKRVNSNQLCLFSAEQMAEMTEVRKPTKIRTDMPFNAWVQWEMELLPFATGERYRDQFAFLSGKVPAIHRDRVMQSDILRSYDAIVDRVRPTLFLY